jgi:NADH dehydrogenase
MRVLVTGGTGVIGAGAIPELLKAGHAVRLLSRGADRDAGEFPHGVEAFAGDVTDPASLHGAADGCETVVHIAGIVEEEPPERTFEKVNVAGTRHLLEEARRGGVGRFVFISSLGANTGQSEYHASKRRAEVIVRSYPAGWVILRPGNVYGPGDEVISLLLKMVRALPVVPTVGEGNQPFQPIWFEDLGKAISLAAADNRFDGQTLELAGEERTTTKQLLDELQRITGRSPARIPVPRVAARAATAVAEAIGRGPFEKSGLIMPLNSSKLQMLLEENVIDPPSRNALTARFGIKPAPLTDGLVKLADALPELMLENGVGSLERKFFWADIQDSRFSAPELLRHFRERITELMPVEFAAEPGVPEEARKGTTLTGAIPGRGNFQVRVERESDDAITLATLEGHPLAGTVTFRSEAIESAVRFMVEILARPSNIIDWIGLRLGGAALQNQNWRALVRKVVESSSGRAEDGIHHQSQTLDESEAEELRRAAEQMIQERKAKEREREVAAAR